MNLNLVHWAFLDFSRSTRSASEAGRYVLSQLLQQDEVKLRVESDPEFGHLKIKKIDGTTCHNLFCNVSHTEKVAVAALSSFPVGIDIEKKDRSAKRVLKKIASEEELRELEKFPSALKNNLWDPALLLWTGKEAVAKAIGLGMRKGLKPFKISASETLPFSAEISVTGPFALKDPRVWYLEKEDFLISICSDLLALKSKPLLLWEGSDS